MYNKILAPMDGSSLSECTIEHVKEIAQGSGAAQIIFLAVVDYAKSSWVMAGDDEAGGGFVSADVIEKLIEAQKKAAEEYLPRLIEEAKKEGLTVKGIVMKGYPPDVIVDYAKENNVDLIVMSTHGRSGVTNFALGSVTDKVLRTSTVPVLVVTPAACRVKI